MKIEIKILWRFVFYIDFDVDVRWIVFNCVICIDNCLWCCDYFVFVFYRKKCNGVSVVYL